MMTVQEDTKRQNEIRKSDRDFCYPAALASVAEFLRSASERAFGDKKFSVGMIRDHLVANGERDFRFMEVRDQRLVILQVLDNMGKEGEVNSDFEETGLRKKPTKSFYWTGV